MHTCLYGYCIMQSFSCCIALWTASEYYPRVWQWCDWREAVLWGEATRSPLIWVAPGVTKPGGVCARPVDFLGIFPTLWDLAGLRLPSHLEEVSFKSLLADPKTAWERPAISTNLAAVPEHSAIKNQLSQRRRTSIVSQ